MRSGFAWTTRSRRRSSRTSPGEDDHRAWLVEEHRRRFGETIPLIRREHVAGFYHRRPVWLIENLGLERIRDGSDADGSRGAGFLPAGGAADERRRDAPAARTTGGGRVRPRSDLAGTARASICRRPPARQRTPRRTGSSCSPGCSPGWPGLMDGSVSTLAPIFAAAFATGDTWKTFLVGLAASVGAGISMGFTEPHRTTARSPVAVRRSSAAWPRV